MNELKEVMAKEVVEKFQVWCEFELNCAKADLEKAEREYDDLLLNREPIAAMNKSFEIERLKAIILSVQAASDKMKRLIDGEEAIKQPSKKEVPTDGTEHLDAFDDVEDDFDFDAEICPIFTDESDEEV